VAFVFKVVSTGRQKSKISMARAELKVKRFENKKV
jgi:hypothetical protein